MESTPISSPACMVSCAPLYCAALRRTLPNNCPWQVRAPGDVPPLQAASPGELHLYEEIIARSATKASLSGGNFLGMMNVLIQLRKVCNHPDLLGPRPLQSPLACAALPLQAAALVTRALERHPLETLTSKVLRFWDFNTDTSARMLMQELVPTQAQFIDIDDIALPTPAASASLFSSNSGVAAASLCGAKFEAVIEQHYALHHDQKLHKMTSNYSLLCTLCCRPRLPLHWRSVRICQQLSDLRQQKHHASLAGAGAFCYGACGANFTTLFDSLCLSSPMWSLLDHSSSPLLVPVLVVLVVVLLILVLVH